MLVWDAGLECRNDKDLYKYLYLIARERMLARMRHSPQGLPNKVSHQTVCVFPNLLAWDDISKQWQAMFMLQDVRVCGIFGTIDTNWFFKFLASQVKTFRQEFV